MLEHMRRAAEIAREDVSSKLRRVSERLEPGQGTMRTGLLRVSLLSRETSEV